VRWLKEDGSPAGIEKADVTVPRYPHDWEMTRMPVVSPRDAVMARIHLVVWAKETDVFIDELGFEQAGPPDRDMPGEAGRAEKMRVMYFPEWVETAEEVRKVRDHGFNVASVVSWKYANYIQEPCGSAAPGCASYGRLASRPHHGYLCKVLPGQHTSFLYWKCYEQKHTDEIAANLALAKEARLPVLVSVWLSAVAPKEFQEKQPLIGASGAAYKRTPSIFHKEWWNEWFAPVCLRFVRQSKDGSILGLWVDFELYDEPNQVSDVCFCQRCLEEWSEAAGVKIAGADAKGRADWLLHHDRIQAFRDFQAAKLGRYAEALRAETDKINPAFVYGNFPYYGYMADRVFAQKLGTKRAPFLIAPEYTYRLQSDKYSDTTGIQLAVCYCREMQRRIRELGLNARLLAGICPLTEATFMRDKIISVCGPSDGYWLWTKRIIDRHRAAFGGKPLTDAEADAAWAALKEANDRLVAGNR
jgi:hypothetical protein